MEDDCFIVLCWFLYNRHESAISIHMSPPSWASLPPPLPPLGRHGAAGWAPCVPQQPPLAGYFTHCGVHVSALLSQFVYSLLFPLCPQVHSLHLHLCSCPANRFIGTIFHVLIFKVPVQMPGPVVILLQTFISLYSSSHPLGPIFFREGNWGSDWINTTSGLRIRVDCRSDITAWAFNPHSLVSFQWGPGSLEIGAVVIQEDSMEEVEDELDFEDCIRKMRITLGRE